MQKTLLIKLGTITLLSLILLIPLEMISNKISERSLYKGVAEQSIAQSWTGSQKIASPVLVIPYALEKDIYVADPDTNQKRVETRSLTYYRFILAEQLSINSKIDTEFRAKGIYEVPVYTAMMNFSGAFDNSIIAATMTEIREAEHFQSFGTAFLTFGVNDLRGINSIPELQWNDASITFEPGNLLADNKSGLHANLANLLPMSDDFNEEEPGLDTPITFQFALELRGMKSQSFVPFAKQTDVVITSPWQHPNFFGDFPPVSRSISTDGFTAQWKTNSFSSNIEDKSLTCLSDQCQPRNSGEFGVSLIEPVDVYLQTERSVKYGILFIGISFVAFFILEVLYKLQIHSIQYMLTGLANAIFYLLLISLSEHLSFVNSYLIATLSCVGLLAFYLRSVLKTGLLALIYSLAILAMYGVLYVIIQSEDYALLMGSVLSFSMLTLIMIATRNIDWAEVSEFQFNRNIE